MRGSSRLLIVGGLAAVLAVVSTACTNSQALPGQPSSVVATPSPSLSAIPSPEPEPTPSATPTLLAKASLAYTLYVKVWDAGEKRAQHGCGCSFDGFDGELYPDGTPIWLLRLDLYAGADHASSTPGYDEHMDMSKVKIDASWGPGRPPAVQADEGKVIAEKQGLAFGLDEAQAAGPLPWESKREFLVAYYVPMDSPTLTLKVSFPTKDNATGSYSLKVPVTSDVATLLYTFP